MGFKASQFPLQQNTAVQYSVSMVITGLHWEGFMGLISHFWTFIFLLRLSKIISLGSKDIKPINLKGNQPWILIGRTQCWSWSSNTLAAWCQQSAHWERPWCWKDWGQEEKRGDRWWDGWMASPIQWTWTWINPRRWWGTGKPGVLGSQRVEHNLAIEWQEQKNHL